MKRYLLRDVPENLWRKFKALAALRGTSARKLLIELIRKEVDKK